MVELTAGLIGDKRIAHSKGVADFMYNNAREYTEVFKEDLYLLGLVHDIGYIFGESVGHGARGGLMLKSLGFKYWREVYWHGKIVINGFKSPFLDLLNWADLNISSSGEVVGYRVRIDSILKNYGVNSDNYKNAVTLSNLLALKGYKTAVE